MIPVVALSSEDAEKVLAVEEGHFADLKAIEIAPSKLTRSLSAFANAEGGELYVGVDENDGSGNRRWRGFQDQEAANGHIQVFEQVFPLGPGYAYSFLRADNHAGLVLKIEIYKSREIRPSSDGTVY